MLKNQYWLLKKGKSSSYFTSCFSCLEQWRNVTIWCPPAHFLPPPQIFLLSPKQKKRKKKKKVATFFKGRHFFFGFSYRLLAPLELFVPPNIFFRVDRTLSWPRYGTFSYFVKTFFVLKTVSLVICRPPKVPPPCIAGVAGAVVTPLV